MNINFKLFILSVFVSTAFGSSIVNATRQPFPTSKQEAEAAFQQFCAAQAGNSFYQKGLALGQEMVDALLAWSNGDKQKLESLIQKLLAMPEIARLMNARALLLRRIDNKLRAGKKIECDYKLLSELFNASEDAFFVGVGIFAVIDKAIKEHKLDRLMQILRSQTNGQFDAANLLTMFDVYKLALPLFVKIYR